MNKEEINYNCVMCKKEINKETKYIIMQVEPTCFWCVNCLFIDEMEKVRNELKLYNEYDSDSCTSDNNCTEITDEEE